MLDFLNGTGVAIITPFHKDGSIDFKSLENLVEHLISGGVNYLVVLGTTGETATLSASEKEGLIAAVLNFNAGRLPVVLGVGGNNTSEVLNQLQEYDFSEIAAILSVSPYYNKPTQEGIFQHYKAVSESSPKPLIIYNVPSRTGSNIMAETTIRISKELTNVVATKEACGNIEQIMQIIAQKPNDFKVISGDDALTLPILAAGGVGVISVVANSFPSQMSELVKAGLKGNFTTARKIHYKLNAITSLHFEEGNPTGVKAFLSALGLCEPYVRLPLVSASSVLKRKIRESVKELKNFNPHYL